jgi:ribose transport system permease protein
MSTATTSVEETYAVPARRLDGSLTRVRDYGVVGVFVALFIALSLTSDAFLTKDNLSNLVEQWSYIGIMACAGTIVIIAGGFDLSVAATFALSGVVAAMVADSTGVLPGFGAGLAVGVVIGFANGWLVTAARVNPFLATLGSAFVLRGIALAMTGGLLVTVEAPSFPDVGRGMFLGFPYTNWTYLVVAVVMAFVLARTTFGRYVYATGANPEAARLAGVSVNRVRLATFVISGLLAAVAGLLSASQAASGQADAGVGFELLTIAAVVLGGTSILGGQGAIWRSVIGTLMLAMIANGSNLLNLAGDLQQIIQGLIILFAVSLDAFTARRRR